MTGAGLEWALVQHDDQLTRWELRHWWDGQPVAWLVSTDVPGTWVAGWPGRPCYVGKLPAASVVAAWYAGVILPAGTPHAVL